MSSGMISKAVTPQIDESLQVRKRFWVGIVHWLLRLGLAGVFIAAAFHKVIDPGSFAVSVYRFDLLPEALVQPMALTLPWLEVVAALALLTTRYWRMAGAWLLVGLLVVFTTAAATAWWRGLNISCGCFSSESPSPITWWLFARNTGFMLAIAALLWLDGRHLFNGR